jgi:hypothetical protein
LRRELSDACTETQIFDLREETDDIISSTMMENQSLYEEPDEIFPVQYIP